MQVLRLLCFCFRSSIIELPRPKRRVASEILAGNANSLDAKLDRHSTLNGGISSGEDANSSEATSFMRWRPERVSCCANFNGCLAEDKGGAFSVLFPRDSRFGTWRYVHG